MSERRSRKQEMPAVIAIKKKLIELGLGYSQEIAPERIDQILVLCQESNEALEIISFLLNALEDNLRAKESFQLLCDLLSCQMDDCEQDLKILEEKNTELLARLKKLSEGNVRNSSQGGRLLFLPDRVINSGTYSLPCFDENTMAKIDAWLARYYAREHRRH